MLSQAPLLMGGAFAAWWLLLRYTWLKARPRRLAQAPVVAAVMAYIVYVTAAFWAGAEFPQFLREHLFDGLAPAAAVGFLVNRVPMDSPRTAFFGSGGRL